MKLMEVTKIEPIDKKKSLIYINSEIAFALYNTEIDRYSIEVNEIIKEQVYQTIMKELLAKRAKTRAMHILKISDRTTYEIKTKLQKCYYPDIVIDQTIQFLVEYGYLDDKSYCRNYYNYKKNLKSRKQIESELLRKGISKELFAHFMNTQELNNEAVCEAIIIKNLIDKRKIDFENISPKDLNKLYGYLIRRGFAYEDIKNVVQLFKQFQLK